MESKQHGRRSATVGRAAATALALLGLAACKGGESSPAPTAAPVVRGAAAAPATPTVTLDAAQQRSEAALLQRLSAGGRFPNDVVNKQNARVFLHLAATSTDPRVQSAALLAMPEVFTHAERYTQQRERMGPEYAQVVMMHLRNGSGSVLGAAIRASKNAIVGDAPNTEIIAKLIDIAANHSSPSGKYEAMEVLWSSSTFRDDAAQHAPYVAALDAPQPWLVSIALFRIHHGFARSYADKPALLTKALVLAQHADPGVRGRAADVLGDLGADATLRTRVVPVLTGLLDDAHPFVKSEAMIALSLMNHGPAIHRIINFVDDRTSNTYDIVGFQDLLGQPARVHHDSSAWSRVSDAALSAIRNYAGRTQTPFRYEVDVHDAEGGLRRAGREARAWYAQHKGEFPVN